MRKAFKYRVEASEAVEQQLTNTLDLCRELYNAAIEERRDAYKLQRISINYNDQADQLPSIKKDRPELKGVHSQVLQEVLKRVESAFDGFFLRIKNGQTPGYPRFKGKDRFDSFTYPQSGFSLENGKLWLSKIGTMKLHLSREIEGQIKTVTIKRESDQWYVSFSCEVEPAKQEPTAKAIGIDMNLENFYTDSNGRRVENPKYFTEAERKLAKAQRQLARKKKGSKNRQRAKKKVNKLHTKIKNQRKDFAHKQSRKLINKYDLIVYENLNIKGMVRNEYLSKSISDVGWGMFFNMLDYKAVEADKRTIDIAPHNTSQLCSNPKCGKKVMKALSQRWHKCPYCGLELSRDHNAALNILARGISVLQAEGLSVSAPGGLALARLMNGEPWDISVHMLPSSLVSQTALSN